ncbi:uncharacterized protein LOC121370522 [Gigantopelta aegis]|uniref:uncharacterized protein LOC121370522 n=1 Tax=Gigantopelta aegis TaxID=1735272 RepID=UPI001B88CF6C|nr:uncharacterized protein LOC121370522 [Gigantopelta aegis]
MTYPRSGRELEDTFVQLFGQPNEQDPRGCEKENNYAISPLNYIQKEDNYATSPQNYCQRENSVTNRPDSPSFSVNLDSSTPELCPQQQIWEPSCVLVQTSVPGDLFGSRFPTHVAYPSIKNIANLVNACATTPREDSAMFGSYNLDSPTPPPEDPGTRPIADLISPSSRMGMQQAFRRNLDYFADHEKSVSRGSSRDTQGDNRSICHRNKSSSHSDLTDHRVRSTSCDVLTDCKNQSSSGEVTDYIDKFSSRGVVTDYRNTPSSSGVVTESRNTSSPRGVVTDYRNKLSPHGVVTESRNTPSPREVVTDYRNKLSPHGVVTESRNKLSPHGVVTESRNTPSSSGVVADYRNTPSSNGVVTNYRNTPSSSGVVTDFRNTSTLGGGVTGYRNKLSPCGVVTDYRNTPSSSGVVTDYRNTPSSGGVVTDYRNTPSSSGVVTDYRNMSSSGGVVTDYKERPVLRDAPDYRNTPKSGVVMDHRTKSSPCHTLTGCRKKSASRSVGTKCRNSSISSDVTENTKMSTSRDVVSDYRNKCSAGDIVTDHRNKSTSSDVTDFTNAPSSRGDVSDYRNKFSSGVIVTDDRNKSTSSDVTDFTNAPSSRGDVSDYRNKFSSGVIVTDHRNMSTSHGTTRHRSIFGLHDVTDHRNKSTSLDTTDCKNVSSLHVVIDHRKRSTSRDTTDCRYMSCPRNFTDYKKKINSYDTSVFKDMLSASHNLTDHRSNFSSGDVVTDHSNKSPSSYTSGCKDYVVSASRHFTDHRNNFNSGYVVTDHKNKSTSHDTTDCRNVSGSRNVTDYRNKSSLCDGLSGYEKQFISSDVVTDCTYHVSSLGDATDYRNKSISSSNFSERTFDEEIFSDLKSPNRYVECQSMFTSSDVATDGRYKSSSGDVTDRRSKSISSNNFSERTFDEETYLNLKSPNTYLDIWEGNLLPLNTSINASEYDTPTQGSNNGGTFSECKKILSDKTADTNFTDCETPLFNSSSTETFIDCATSFTNINAGGNVSVCRTPSNNSDFIDCETSASWSNNVRKSTARRTPSCTSTAGEHFSDATFVACRTPSFNSQVGENFTDCDTWSSSSDTNESIVTCKLLQSPGAVKAGNGYNIYRTTSCTNNLDESFIDCECFSPLDSTVDDFTVSSRSPSNNGDDISADSRVHRNTDNNDIDCNRTPTNIGDNFITAFCITPSNTGDEFTVYDVTAGNTGDEFTVHDVTPSNTDGDLSIQSITPSKIGDTFSVHSITPNNSGDGFTGRRRKPSNSAGNFTPHSYDNDDVFGSIMSSLDSSYGNAGISPETFVFSCTESVLSCNLSPYGSVDVDQAKSPVTKENSNVFKPTVPVSPAYDSGQVNGFVMPMSDCFEKDTRDEGDEGVKAAGSNNKTSDKAIECKSLLPSHQITNVNIDDITDDTTKDTCLFTVSTSSPAGLSAVTLAHMAGDVKDVECESPKSVKVQRSDTNVLVTAQHIPDKTILVTAQDMPDKTVLVPAQDMPDKTEFDNIQDTSDTTVLVTALDISDAPIVVTAQDISDETVLVDEKDISDETVLVNAEEISDETVSSTAQDTQDKTMLINAQDIPDTTVSVNAQNIPESSAHGQSKRDTEDACETSADRRLPQSSHDSTACAHVAACNMDNMSLEICSAGDDYPNPEYTTVLESLCSSSSSITTKDPIQAVSASDVSDIVMQKESNISNDNRPVPDMQNQATKLVSLDYGSAHSLMHNEQKETPSVEMSASEELTSPNTSDTSKCDLGDFTGGDVTLIKELTINDSLVDGSQSKQDELSNQIVQQNECGDGDQTVLGYKHEDTGADSCPGVDENPLCLIQKINKSNAGGKQDALEFITSPGKDSSPKCQLEHVGNKNSLTDIGSPKTSRNQLVLNRSSTRMHSPRMSRTRLLNRNSSAWIYSPKISRTQLAKKNSSTGLCSPKLSRTRLLNRNSSAGINSPRMSRTQLTNTNSSAGTRSPKILRINLGNKNSSSGLCSSRMSRTQLSPKMCRRRVGNRNANGITFGVMPAEYSTSSLDPTDSAHSSFLSCASFHTFSNPLPECNSFTEMPLCSELGPKITNINTKSDSVRIAIPNTSMVLDIKVQKSDSVSMGSGCCSRSASKVIIEVFGANMTVGKSRSRNEIICSPCPVDDGVVDQVLVECISNAVDICSARKDRACQANWITPETVSNIVCDDLNNVVQSWVVTTSDGNQFQTDTIEISPGPSAVICMDTAQPSEFTLQSGQEMYRSSVESNQLQFGGLKNKGWQSEESVIVEQPKGPGLSRYTYKSVEERSQDSSCGSRSPKPGCFRICFKKRAKSPGRQELVLQTVSRGSQKSEYEYQWTAMDDNQDECGTLRSPNDSVHERRSLFSRSSSGKSPECVESVTKVREISVHSSSPGSRCRSPHRTESVTKIHEVSVHSSPRCSRKCSPSVESITKVSVHSSPGVSKRSSSRSVSISPQRVESVTKIKEVTVVSSPRSSRRSSLEGSRKCSPRISRRCSPEVSRRSQSVTEINEVCVHESSPKSIINNDTCTKVYIARECSESSEDYCDDEDDSFGNARGVLIHSKSPGFGCPEECESYTKITKINVCSTDSSLSLDECDSLTNVHSIRVHSRSPRNRCRDEGENVRQLFRQMSAVNLKDVEDDILDMPCPRRRAKSTSSVRRSINKFFSHTSTISLCEYRSVEEEIYPKEVLKKLKHLEYAIYMIRVPVQPTVKIYKAHMLSDSFCDKAERGSIRFRSSSTTQCSELNTSFDTNTQVFSQGSDHGKNVTVSKTHILHTIESRIKGTVSHLESFVNENVHPIIAHSLNAAILDIRRQINALPDNVCCRVQAICAPIACQSVCRSVCGQPVSETVCQTVCQPVVCQTVCPPVVCQTVCPPALSHSVDRVTKTKFIDDGKASMYQRISRNTDVCKPSSSAGSTIIIPQHTSISNPNTSTVIIPQRTSGSHTRQVHIEVAGAPCRSRWKQCNSLSQTAGCVAKWAIESSQKELHFILEREQGDSGLQDITVITKERLANEVVLSGSMEDQSKSLCGDAYRQRCEGERQCAGETHETEAQKLTSLFLDAVVCEIKARLDQKECNSAMNKGSSMDSVIAAHAIWLVEEVMDKVVCDVQNQLITSQQDPRTPRCLVDVFGCLFGIEVIDTLKEAVYNAMYETELDNPNSCHNVRWPGDSRSNTSCKVIYGPDGSPHSIRRSVNDFTISITKGLSEEARRAEELRRAEDARRLEEALLAEELRRAEDDRRAEEFALQTARLEELERQAAEDMERAKLTALEKERLGVLNAEERSRFEDAERARLEALDRSKRDAIDRARLEKELARLKAQLEDDKDELLKQRFSKEEKFMRKTLAHTKTGDSEAERIFEKHLNMALSRQASMVAKKALVSALLVANLEKKIHYGLLVLNIEYALNVKMTSKKLDSKKMSKDTKKLIKDFVHDKDDNEVRLLSVKGQRIRGYDVKLNLENRDLSVYSRPSQGSIPSYVSSDIRMSKK